MRIRVLSRSLVALALLAVPFAGVPAQERSPEGGAVDQEVRERVRSYFETRLRVELGMTDEQFERVLPSVEALHRERIRTRRERGDVARALRRGLRDGATDEELSRQLERLDRLHVEQGTREAELLREIDRELTVRQRVQLRFFLSRFQRDVEMRVRALGRDRGRRGESRRR